MCMRVFSECVWIYVCMGAGVSAIDLQWMSSSIRPPHTHTLLMEAQLLAEPRAHNSSLL